MALSEDDQKQVKSLMSDAMAEGLMKFRSMMEEENAKKPPIPPAPPADGGDSGFDFGSFLLGGYGK